MSKTPGNALRQDFAVFVECKNRVLITHNPLLIWWKRRAATGPERRNHLSHSKQTKRRFCDFFDKRHKSDQ